MESRPAHTADPGLLRTLGPFDATCIVIGAIIGVGIFFTPTQIARKAGSDPPHATLPAIACLLIIALAAANVIGVRFGSAIQSATVVAKVAASAFGVPDAQLLSGPRLVHDMAGVVPVDNVFFALTGAALPVLVGREARRAQERGGQTPSSGSAKRASDRPHGQSGAAVPHGQSGATGPHRLRIADHVVPRPLPLSRAPDIPFTCSTLSCTPHRMLG